ncbi:hypothetical protein Tco_0405778, partial [Tanacetum coccineum]
MAIVPEGPSSGAHSRVGRVLPGQADHSLPHTQKARTPADIPRQKREKRSQTSEHFMRNVFVPMLEKMLAGVSVNEFCETSSKHLCLFWDLKIEDQKNGQFLFCLISDGFFVAGQKLSEDNAKDLASYLQ